MVRCMNLPSLLQYLRGLFLQMTQHSGSPTPVEQCLLHTHQSSDSQAGGYNPRAWKALANQRPFKRRDESLGMYSCQDTIAFPFTYLK